MSPRDGLSLYEQGHSPSLRGRTIAVIRVRHMEELEFRTKEVLQKTKSEPDILGLSWAHPFTQTAKTSSLLQQTGGYHKNPLAPVT